MEETQQSLFTAEATAQSPLAHSLRPQSLADIVGQSHFLNERFHKILTSDRWTGFIFWGPPGTGKTTLAKVISQITDRPFDTLSAVTAGVKELREVLEKSKSGVRLGQLARILFIDEIHRFNKAQQDVLLPYLEEGSVRFIGATTENPSFEINRAIASRCLIFPFQALTPTEIKEVLRRASRKMPPIDEAVLDRLAEVSLGDARRALTLLEHLSLCAITAEKITLQDFEAMGHSQALYYDKKSDAHYDTISAFIKSVRGSDPDAAVYYLARMLEAGEDPLFIARRLIVLASEDIGNANPAGLMLATSALTAVHAIGMPEARIVLSQVTTYLACSEKSNRSYTAIEQAAEAVKVSGALEIPKHLRNATTGLMKEMGYGKNYHYPHEEKSGWVKQDYLPEKLKDSRFYVPTEHGSEKRFVEFLKSRKASQNQTK